MKIYYYEDTSSAYDDTQSQYLNEVVNGDILVIESEKVVGVADTWPVSVTSERGELHSLKEESTIIGIIPDMLEYSKLSVDELKASFSSAIELAKSKGFEISKQSNEYIGENNA